MPFPFRADFMLPLTFISFFFQKETKLFFFHMFAKHFEGKGGSQSLQSFALFLLSGLCNSLWALTMSENSMSIQSREVCMCEDPPWPQTQTESFASWCCLPSHDMHWRAGYLLHWALETEYGKESSFWSDKRSPRFTPPTENSIFYLFIWFPLSFAPRDADVVMGRGKCLVSSLPVLDTLLCNLYVNHTGINQVGKGWVASNRNV